MARAQQYQQIDLLVTPASLRSFADRLEELWSKSVPGNPVPRVIFEWGVALKVDFVIDQAEMHEIERRKNEEERRKK